MSSVYMIVFTVGLAVQILAAAICEEGAVRFINPDLPLPSRGPDAGYAQICLNNDWAGFCGKDFNRVEANVVCKQLGYIGSSDKGYTNWPGVPKKYITINTRACAGHEREIRECTLNEVVTLSTCTMNNWAKCLPTNCTTGSLRLVGGASYREGRVEVCVDGRWGTVCYNEELAGTVCQQLGFGSQGVITTNISIPLPKVNCNIDNAEQLLSCENITQQQTCEALTVHCAKNIENCSANEPTAKSMNTDHLAVDQTGGTNNTTLGVLIGLLALLEIATVIGCILCIIRRKTTPPKPPRARGTSFINESYETNPPVQSEYSTVGPHYDVLKRDEPPKIELYQPAHPPPVGGVSDDEFYNAEDHTYAAVPKKDKVKKQEGGAN